ncbi:MAG: DUF5683 domain-containing protein [Dysgonamonadaceae bacterium]|jgi:hypothetical protein|nr:DUF5683 domain-containing protein [Dysgonamonadaceae bacterium]
MDNAVKTGLFFFFCLSLSLSIRGQEQATPLDSLATFQVEQSNLILTVDTTVVAHEQPADSLYFVNKPIPAKAAIMSAVLPGLGQIYNRKYWKVPIAYALIGASVYFLIRTQNDFQRYRRAYIDLKDGDPYSNFHKKLNIPSYYNEEQYITSYKDGYRRYRDWAIIAVVITYLMNVVDANVDAHLFDYSIDDNISFHAKPHFFKDNITDSPKFNLTLCFSF